jgi:hypothetical protein
MIVYKIIAGLVNESNIKRRITNINAIETANQRAVALRSSAFSCHSPAASMLIHSGRFRLFANSNKRL